MIQYDKWINIKRELIKFSNFVRQLYIQTSSSVLLDIYLISYHNMYLLWSSPVPAYTKCCWGSQTSWSCDEHSLSPGIWNGAVESINFNEGYKLQKQAQNSINQWYLLILQNAKWANNGWNIVSVLANVLQKRCWTNEHNQKRIDRMNFKYELLTKKFCFENKQDRLLYIMGISTSKIWGSEYIDNCRGVDS